MKKTITLLSFILASGLLMAQTPQLMSYQAVVRNSNNILVSNSLVSMRISVLQGSSIGTSVYTEIHNVSTNSNGLAAVAIGSGTAQSGTFSGINWANGPYFVKAETDPSGGSNYSIASTTQLLSVPYALFAEKSGTPGTAGPQGPIGPQGPKGDTGLTGPQGAQGATGSFQAGTVPGQMLYWNGTTWVNIAPGTRGQNLTFCDGFPIWGPCPGIINTIACGSATTTGMLTRGTSATNVGVTIGYSGGDGGTYTSQSISSTGVTGLTADLAAGSFANGSGSITYTISGTPAAAGTATFTITIGGQSCSFSLNVIHPVGIVSTLDCGTATTTGTLTRGTAATSVSTAITYTGGNGGTYTSQSISSTGVTGLTADLAAGILADGTGSITYTITGTPATAGTATFDIATGGQNCSFTLNVLIPVGVISTLGCGAATTSGTLSEGTSATSVSTSIAYTGGNGGTYTAQSISSTGVTGLTADLAAGILADGTGSITYTITGTPATSGTATFAISVGGQSCSFTLNVLIPVGTISTLNCGGATTTGTLTQGLAAASVSTTIAYTGGNGGTYAAQAVSSTGVSGLTANLAAGTLSNGTSNLIYTITGTPATAGSATFAIAVGGQSCSFAVIVGSSSPQYAAGTVHCGGTPTAIVNVTNPTTGKIWMDRNLGATQVATSSTDAAAYGDLYQWGRRSDGHQCRNSATTSTLSSSDQPSHGNFILSPNSPNDWRSPQNANLWQGVNGVNNPCPSTYRVPTINELDAERISWSSTGSAGAYASPLKLTMGGYRGGDGSLGTTEINAYYWSSTVNGASANNLVFLSGGDLTMNNFRVNGFSVRCIKDNFVGGSINTLDCGAATTTGTLTQGLAATSVSTTIAYTGGNGGTYASQAVSSTGVSGLTANLAAGTLSNGTGNLIYTITGTPATAGSATFAITVGGQSCSFTLNVLIPVGTISTLNCGAATTTGTLTQGLAAASVSTAIAYTGGNGGTYAAQAVSSTGVTGLTANLAAGTLSNGPGIITYTITGTPATAGSATFAIAIGGQSCSFVLNVVSPYSAGTVHCGGTPTAIVNVTNPTTGKIWMDRNLGATQVATSSTDAAAYGDLYQWGRRSDGHQCRNSATTSTLSSSDQPSHGNFILSPNSPNDWRSPQNANLWQGVNGVNNPCPSTYRVPTINELDAERISWSSTGSAGAYASPLKLTMGGYRGGDGSLGTTEINAYYWSSTVNGASANNLVFLSGGDLTMNNFRVNGFSVRCIKDNFVGGSINTLDCGAATTTGTLTQGLAATSVSTTIAYTGGNGGTYASQAVSSTGVSGLTANLAAGTLSNGTGNLIYTITGTPATAGSATFAITVGGQSCSFTLNVLIPVGTISTLDCGAATTTGTLTQGTSATSVSTAIAYTGGNGGTYAAQAVSSTGVSGLTANLAAGTLSNGTGNLIYTITGTPVTAGSATFAITVGGQSCSFTLNVLHPVGIVGTLDCGTATTTGTLTRGLAATSVSTTIAYTGGNGGTYASQAVSSTGVTGLTADLAAGTLSNGTGNLIYTITGTPATAGSATFAITVGGQSCSFTLNVLIPVGTISTLDCGAATTTGTLTQGTSATSVSTAIAYTGGNGGTYAAQAVSSTGVSGLTANLAAGILSNGTGNLNYTITGTPTTAGSATFAIAIGGQSCSLVLNVVSPYSAGTVHCNGTPTAIVNVTNPTTGKIWMDRNLGATQVATSSTDAAAYGDLYQWGRRSDGHQCRNSATTSTLSSSDQPSHGSFILSPNSPNDWRSPQNANLWQGVNGVNNPCPSTYRVPTINELNAERISWSSTGSAGAYASPLKLTMGGYRGGDGSLGTTEINAYYWSSTVNGASANNLVFLSGGDLTMNNFRVNGFSVRCIKD